MSPGNHPRSNHLGASGSGAVQEPGTEVGLVSLRIKSVDLSDVSESLVKPGGGYCLMVQMTWVGPARTELKLFVK